jgi:hypothetical protein
VLSTLLRTAALLAALVVTVSFGLFVIDEASDASKRSVAAIAGLDATRSPSPTATEERAREKSHGAVREVIDDANDVLVAPFAEILPNSGSSWRRRGAPALLALLVYGFGLGFLARFALGR